MDVLLAAALGSGAGDLVVAHVCLAGTAVILGGVVVSDWMPLEVHVLAQWGYPELRLAAAAAVLVVVGPELVRSVRLLAFCARPAGRARRDRGRSCAAVLGARRAGAWPWRGVARAPRLRHRRRRPAGRRGPSRAASLGLEVDRLAPPAEQQRRRGGLCRATSRDGSPLRVRVLGRDAQDTQRVRAGGARSPTATRRGASPSGGCEQVEHEALATLMAAQAGVRVPPVVTAALGPNGDALIATEAA